MERDGRSLVWLRLRNTIEPRGISQRHVDTLRLQDPQNSSSTPQQCSSPSMINTAALTSSMRQPIVGHFTVLRRRWERDVSCAFVLRALCHSELHVLFDVSISSSVRATRPLWKASYRCHEEHGRARPHV